MALIKTSNPALGDKTFTDLANAGPLGDIAAAGRMTLSGTVNKTGILLLCSIATAAWTWRLFLQSEGDASAVGGLMLGGLIGGFIVLMPSTSDAVALAADCVRAFHRFRAPLAAPDRARRIAAGLTARQLEHLERWGYPYVLDEFRLHMTLAGPLPTARREPMRTALAALFAAQADRPLLIDAVSLVRQDDGAARFRVVRREPLRG